MTKKGKEPKITGENVKSEPAFTIAMREDSLVVAADFFKVMIDQKAGLGTLVFFQRRPIPKRKQKGLVINAMVDEGFLEVKVPLNTLFATVVYLWKVFREIQENPEESRKYITFGPSSVEER